MKEELYIYFVKDSNGEIHAILSNKGDDLFETMTISSGEGEMTLGQIQECEPCHDFVNELAHVMLAKPEYEVRVDSELYYVDVAM